MEIEKRGGTIGIVTVTYNSGTVLADFIASLEGQSYGNFLVYAVDNASKDETIPMLEAWKDSRLRIIPNETNVGVAAGNNQGIKAALSDGCDYVLLLNNDVYFGADLLQGLLDGLAEHSCSMITPLIYYSQPDNMIWCAGGEFRKDFAWLSIHYGFKELDEGKFNEAKQISFCPTCCLLMKSEVFDKVGLMDERYFVLADDTDFMYRALQAGIVTYYIPNIKLYHKVSVLRGEESPFSQRYYSRNRAFFIKKHLGWWTTFQFTWLYRAYFFSRWLTRKDSWETMVRKERGWSEGLRIQ
jgi:GT2 family glycosyltransferase